jgi:hypothetical protein
MPFAVSVGDSLQRGFDQFFAFLPNILGFLVILLIGYVIAKVAKTAINKIMDSLGVDRRLHQSPAGQYLERVSPGSRPSHLIGAVAFWFIFLFALSAAIGALKIAALSTFIAQVQAFLPNVIVAVLIFVVAAGLAGGVAGVVQKMMGDTPTGKIVTAVVPGLILAIGLFMVLDQLQIAPQIVTITYAALLGMLALAGALAFGSAAATSPPRCSARPTRRASRPPSRPSRTSRPASSARSRPPARSRPRGRSRAARPSASTATRTAGATSAAPAAAERSAPATSDHTVTANQGTVP